MATYLEIYDLYSNDELRNRISVAVVVEAEVIRNENPATVNHANRLIWAKEAFQNPDEKAKEMLKALLAANKNNSVGQITGATDTVIQTNVAATVDIFATG